VTVPRALRAFVFLGAFLLFAMEPLAGRQLVARFGGAFYVWTSALMFFQVALVGGYLYAHRVAGRIGRWHLAAVLACLALLPPAVASPPADADARDVVVALGLRAAALAALLSATSVTAQRALAGRVDDRALYALYALSNAGSLAALAVDALLFSPLLGLGAQAALWSALFALYAVAAVAALRGLRPEDAPAPAPPTPARDLAVWCAVAALTAAALSAVTNQLTLDAGQVPLLWTLPLGIYLGTFVLAFARVDRVPVAVRVVAPQAAAAGVWLCLGGDAGSPALQAALHLGCFALVVLAAHAELYAARPEPARLGAYYLAIAVGGAVGGALVALAAPRVFTSLAELPLALVGVVLAMAWLRRSALRAWLRAAPRRDVLARAAVPTLVVARLLLGARGEDGVRDVAARRSPYGLYHVLERADAAGRVRELVSGTTRHGRQRVGSPEPLSYYHRAGSLGDAVASLRRPAGARRMGIVGLGVGAAAAYLAPGDRAVAFEIDPVVVALARAHFRFLADARGAVTVVTGDARARMTARDDVFDLLLVDAFAGDAIPTHLLTREAVSLAMRRTAPDGIALFHVSNRFYDLRPVLAATARDLGLALRWRERLTGLAEAEDPSRYVALARDPRALAALVARGWRDAAGLPRIAAWTDDRADPLGLFLRQRLGW
jgi:spermidine synthase